jgi:hypothetical protein
VTWKRAEIRWGNVNGSPTWQSSFDSRNALPVVESLTLFGSASIFSWEVLVLVVLRVFRPYVGEVVRDDVVELAPTLTLLRGPVMGDDI